MVRIRSELLALWMTAAAMAPAGAQTVFACEPEWAVLTRVLLPAAQVHTATHAGQDPHHIEARPALIAQLRSADAAICTGAGLEAGWLPTLQQRAGNARVQDGAPGLFFAAGAVSLLDPRPGAGGNPFAGDVHADGNPHLHTDPRRLATVAVAWSVRLQQLFPAQKAAIAEREAAFTAAWRSRIAAWEQKAAPLRGQPLAVQHTSLGYLWAWLGLRAAADLEPRPGFAPTPGHLQALLAQLRPAPPLAIVTTSYQDPRAARWLAQQLGGTVPVLQLPATVDDAPAPDALNALGRWIDGLLDPLLTAAAKR